MVLRNSRKPCIFNGFRAMTGIQRFYFDFLMLYTFWVALSAGFRFDEIWYKIVSFPAALYFIYYIIGKGCVNEQILIDLFGISIVLLFWNFDVLISSNFAISSLIEILIVNFTAIIQSWLFNIILLCYHTILLLSNFAILLFWN